MDYRIKNPNGFIKSANKLDDVIKKLEDAIETLDTKTNTYKKDLDDNNANNIINILICIKKSVESMKEITENDKNRMSEMANYQKNILEKW